LLGCSSKFVPTGTTYTIVFGDDKGLPEVQLSDQRIFSDLVDRLWRAVGVRLLLEWMRGLREGGRYPVGTAALDDRGVELPKHRGFKAHDRVYVTWDRIRVWMAEGSFYIGVKGDRTVSVALPYRQANNAHVLSVVMMIMSVLFRTIAPNTRWAGAH